MKIGKQTCASLKNIPAIRLMRNIQTDLVAKAKLLFGSLLARTLRMKLEIPVILEFTETEWKNVGNGFHTIELVL